MKGLKHPNLTIINNSTHGTTRYGFNFSTLSGWISSHGNRDSIPRKHSANVWQAYTGIYQLLPLGLRVQEKLEKLIDKHMRRLGEWRMRGLGESGSHSGDRGVETFAVVAIVAEAMAGVGEIEVTIRCLCLSVVRVIHGVDRM